MNLIKLSTKFYPYTIAELQADYPNVSFPVGLEGVDLGDFDAAEVITDEPPLYNPDLETVEPLPPKKMKGVWRVRWEKRKLTKAEIKARTPADWEGFADLLMGDDDFNDFYVIAMKKKPAVANSLISELGNVPINLRSFAPRFNQFCQVAGVGNVRRGEWADTADGCFLPDQFIAVLRGDDDVN
jgi:hypothetical protein